MKPKNEIEGFTPYFTGEIGSKNRMINNWPALIAPYYAEEIEEAMLGAMLQDKDFYYLHADRINLDFFYSANNRTVFEIIDNTIKAGKNIDLRILTQILKDLGKYDEVSPVYITRLVSKANEALYQSEDYFELLQRAYRRRKLENICIQSVTKIKDLTFEPEEVAAEIQKELIELYENSKQGVHIFADAIEDIQKRIAANLTTNGLTGLSTGLFKLDHFTGGLQKTDLIIIAAETSQGKTALVTNIALASAKKKAKIAFYSLEMSKAQLTARILSIETGVSSKRILNNSLSKSELETVGKGIEDISTLSIYFDEKSTNSIDNICNSIRKLKLKFNIDIAIVDYLQLIQNNSKNKTEENQIAEVARKLKNIAIEQKIVVMALSQLSRDKNNPEPKTNRLRGSGQIEEAADIIILLYRPEEYQKTVFPQPFAHVNSKGLAQIHIAKGRNIGTGSFLLKFTPETTAFYDYVPEYEHEIQYNPNAFIESNNE